MSSIKTILILLTAVFLLGAGCVKSNVSNETAPFVGVWLYGGASVAHPGAVDSVVMQIDPESAGVSGKFHSILHTAQTVAAYEDEGEFSAIVETVDGTVQLQADWTGTRQDAGSATLRLDRATGELVWEAEVTTDDGVYTVPSSMRLLPETQWRLTQADKTVIEEKALAAVPELGDAAAVTIDVAAGEYVRVMVEAATADAPVYLVLVRRADGSGWEVVYGPGTTDEGEFEVPATLLYY